MKGRSIKNGDYQDLEQKLVLRWTSMKGRSIKNGDPVGIMSSAVTSCLPQ